MNLTKKYFFTGTHSTGKTTILDELKKSTVFNNFEFHNSVTRKVKESGYKINTEATDTDQCKIIELVDEYYDNLGSANIVFDRCVVDTLAYTMYLFDTGNVSKSTVDYCINVFNKYKNMHDHIFYFKTEFDVVIDDVRVDNNNFRVNVEKNIELILHQNDIPYTLVTGDVAVRVNIIENIAIQEKNIFNITDNQLEECVQKCSLNSEFIQDQYNYYLLNKDLKQIKIFGIVDENNRIVGIIHYRKLDNNLFQLISIYKLHKSNFKVGKELLHHYSRLMKYNNIQYSIVYIRNSAINFYKEKSILPIGEYLHYTETSIAYFDNTLKSTTIHEEHYDYVHSLIKN